MCEMMKTVRLSLPLTALFCLLAISAAGQTFRATHLERAAKVLRLNARDLTADTLPAWRYLQVEEVPVVVRLDAAGVVDHIGMQLFAEALRQLHPSPIYDYLEFTALDHHFKVSKNTLLQQELRFETGWWSMMPSLMRETDGCSIDNIDERFYRVSWTQHGRKKVTVVFPINYELLANSTRKEMERDFVRDLRTFLPDSSRQAPRLDSRLAPARQDDVMVREGISYLMPEINDNRYLSVADTAHFIFDAAFPQESLANLLVEEDMPLQDTHLTLEVVRSDFTCDTLRMSMRKWLQFCRRQGCRPFFGWEGCKDGVMRATQVLSNKPSGYDHVVSVECSEEDLFQAVPALHARVHLFTPSSNVRSLFGVAQKPNRPKIKYSK